MRSQPNNQGSGIWKYADRLPSIPSEHLISLGEGGTPLVRAALLGLSDAELWFKREDQNPTGSHKARSLSYRMSLAKSRGEQRVVLSSSGNAAINALAYGQKAGVHVYALVSPQTDPGKVAALVTLAQAPYGHLAFSERPMRIASYLAARFGMSNLRPSLDDDSLPGYQTIAYELVEQHVQIEHVFTFVTSGSSLLGMHQGFTVLKDQGIISRIPALHAVQSGEAHSIASVFELSVAVVRAKADQNLGVKDSKRTAAVVQALKETGGRGWFVRSEAIDDARAEFREAGIETSWEGCAAYSAVKTAREQAMISGSCICVLTGKSYPSDNAEVGDIPMINSFAEADDWVRSV